VEPSKPAPSYLDDGDELAAASRLHQRMRRHAEIASGVRERNHLGQVDRFSPRRRSLLCVRHRVGRKRLDAHPERLRFVFAGIAAPRRWRDFAGVAFAAVLSASCRDHRVPWPGDHLAPSRQDSASATFSASAASSARRT
jgi:hypothetical protein